MTADVHTEAPRPLTVAWGHPAPHSRPTPTALTAAFCARSGYTLAQLRGRDRNAPIARARQELMALLYDTGRSFPWVGKFLHRDHTTVLHGVRAHKARLAEREAA